MINDIFRRLPIRYVHPVAGATWVGACGVNLPHCTPQLYTSIAVKQYDPRVQSLGLHDTERFRQWYKPSYYDDISRLIFLAQRGEGGKVCRCKILQIVPYPQLTPVQFKHSCIGV